MVFSIRTGLVSVILVLLVGPAAAQTPEKFELPKVRPQIVALMTVANLSPGNADVETIKKGLEIVLPLRIEERVGVTIVPDPGVKKTLNSDPVKKALAARNMKEVFKILGETLKADTVLYVGCKDSKGKCQVVVYAYYVAQGKVGNVVKKMLDVPINPLQLGEVVEAIDLGPHPMTKFKVENPQAVQMKLSAKPRETWTIEDLQEHAAVVLSQQFVRDPHAGLTNNAEAFAEFCKGFAATTPGDREFYFNQALLVDPQFGYAYYLRGLTLASNQNKINETIADLSRALELAPGIWNAALFRGQCFLAKRLVVEALSDFNTVIQCNPFNAYFYMLRGQVMGMTQKFPAAVDDFTMAILLSESPDSYGGRGSTYLQMGQPVKALKDLEKCEALGRKIRPDLMAQLRKQVGSGTAAPATQPDAGK